MVLRRMFDIPFRKNVESQHLSQPERVVLVISVLEALYFLLDEGFVRCTAYPAAISPSGYG
jgi:hypothetical protein